MKIKDKEKISERDDCTIIQCIFIVVEENYYVCIILYGRVGRLVSYTCCFN